MIYSPVPANFTHQCDEMLETAVSVDDDKSNLQWDVVLRVRIRGEDGTPEEWWVHSVGCTDEDGQTAYHDNPCRTMRDMAASILLEHDAIRQIDLGDADEVIGPYE